VLAFNRLRATAFTDFLLLIADFGNEIGECARVGFEAGRLEVNLGRDNVVDGESYGIGTLSHGGRLGNTYYISVPEGGEQRLTV
jgi:hypothetical protein